LERFLGALALAGRNNWAAALAVTDSLEVYFNATDSPVPFARAAFHLQRGAWLAAAGDLPGGDREWLWYEAGDFEGWPQGPAQAGELDGMLGVFARLVRGEALLHPQADGSDRARGCAYVKRVVQLWSESDAAFQGLVQRADSLQRTCPP
jgi:hypothetical protein